MNTKILWIRFSDLLGRTILHPQFYANVYAWQAVEMARKHAKGKLLDIGCGRMPYRKLIEPKVKEYIALDHPETEKLYEEKLKPDIFADATDIPLKKNSIDSVLMLMVLEHLPEPQKALAEINRLLKKDAVAVISTVQMYPIHDAPYDYFRYTKYGFETICSQAGLEIVEIRSYGSFFTFWGQSLNIYLFQSLKQLLKRKETAPVALILLPIFYTISIISNCIMYIPYLIIQDNDSSFNISHVALTKIHT